MRTWKFPNMFNTNSSNIWNSDEHMKATRQSASLLLNSERNELFGDPYYGVLFKHYLFEQNNMILRDAVIDIVYTQLVLFIPQLRIERRNIDVIQDLEHGKLYCKFTAISQIDFTNDTYTLVMYSESGD